jgi:hypothetical protein
MGCNRKLFMPSRSSHPFWTFWKKKLLCQRKQSGLWSAHLPKVYVIVAQKLGALSVDRVDDITVEEVSRDKARKDFRNLFRVIAAPLQRREKLVLVETM